VAEKSHYYPNPCKALWGRGKRGCYLYGPEDLLKRKLIFLMKN
jgi:hypothetical protein